MVVVGRMVWQLSLGGANPTLGWFVWGPDYRSQDQAVLWTDSL